MDHQGSSDQLFCHSGYTTMLISPKDLIAIARSTISECSLDEVQKHLGADALLIDVRETAEFLKGYIRGATHIPRGTLEFQVHKLVETSCVGDNVAAHQLPIVVCCGTGGRSALSALSLQSLGYQNVRSLSGGMESWIAAGLPIELAD
jgi:rhodanese-related sulfurtransferase